jgi:hypothetical protein
MHRLKQARAPMRKRVTIQGRSIFNSGYPGDASLTAANSNLAGRGEIDDVDLLLPKGSEAINTSPHDEINN